MWTLNYTHTHIYHRYMYPTHMYTCMYTIHTHQKLEIVMRSVKEGIGKFMSPHKCSRVFAGDMSLMMLTLVLTD